jgi:transposase
MGAVSVEGDLYTLVRDRALRSQETIWFLEHLQRQAALRTQGRLLVVWDRSPIHRSEPVQSFLAVDPHQPVVTELLPPYAPELNPAEGVWQNLKHVELANVYRDNLEDLRSELQLAIRRLRKRPQVIQSFFAGAELAL